MRNAVEQIKFQKETNNTLQKVHLFFKKRTSRKAKISRDGFTDLTLNNKKLEDVIPENTLEISRGQNTVLVHVNYNNSGSKSDNYYFIIEEQEYIHLENEEKYFKNLTK